MKVVTKIFAITILNIFNVSRVAMLDYVVDCRRIPIGYTMTPMKNLILIIFRCLFSMLNLLRVKAMGAFITR